MITYRPSDRLFRLQGRGASYLMGVSPLLDLHHLHWGRTLSPAAERALLARWRKASREDEHHVSREFQRREFADFGHNDLRTPAFQVEQADGTFLSEFRYSSHRILEGKPGFGPGPSSDGTGEGVQTLRVDLKDRLKGHKLELYFTLYPERDILVRRARFLNEGEGTVRLVKFGSLGLDFPPGPWGLVRFPGRWAQERRMRSQPLQEGTVRLESRRGISSHEMNPFAMVTKGAASEDRGEVYGFALATSGNWLLEAELFRDQGLRINAGLNDFGFRWQVRPGESFTSPECVTAYSPSGFSVLSLSYHRFVREKVLRGEWKDRPRPMLINNWEATYFKFDHRKLLDIARAGREAGLELFVLDDGWFGRRDDDTSSLGDWRVDRRKLPKGLRGLSDDVHALGMGFGLWIEPEMVSPKSLLYRRHPDWCLHAKGRVRRGARSQLVLDMSRPEVRQYLFDSISESLEEANVDYVKWDMNRSLSEVANEVLPPGRQGELYYRWLLGVYELMDRLNKRFPRVLFEGCSGGGARFDLGILHYHPQIWTSDNTDGLERVLIQYATSFAYPPLVMGAHISSVPNHITHRSIPLKWRALAALSGNFGVEADITKWGKKDRRDLAGYIALYKEIRPLVQFGDFYRLESTYGSERASWMFVDPARTEALLFVFQIKPRPRGEKVKGLRLKGLKAGAQYRIEGVPGTFTGKTLMEGWTPRGSEGRKKWACEMYRLKSR